MNGLQTKQIKAEILSKYYSFKTCFKRSLYLQYFSKFASNKHLSIICLCYVSSIGTPTKDFLNEKKNKSFASENYSSLLLSCHHTYSMESTYYMKCKLFTLTQHPLHSSILYLFQYASLFSLSLLLSSFPNFCPYIWKKLFGMRSNKDCWFST